MEESKAHIDAALSVYRKVYQDYDVILMAKVIIERERVKVELDKPNLTVAEILVIEDKWAGNLYIFL